MPCSDEQKFSQMDAIARLVAKTAKADEELLDIDGVRLTGPDGWFLLRASNTEPALVARAEGRTADQLDSQLHRLQSILAEVGIDWQPGSR